MNKTELTFENFSTQFQEEILTDKFIIALFVVASMYDDEDHCPTQNGNLSMWVEVMADEWLMELWEEYEANDAELDEIDRMNINERLDAVMRNVYLYLFKVINSEAIDIA